MDNIESAQEMLAKIAAPVVDIDEALKSRPLVYWANRLCGALEAKVIDADLVQRCIDNIRKYS